MQDARVIVSSRLEKTSSETWGTVRWLYLSLLLHLIANGLRLARLLACCGWGRVPVPSRLTVGPWLVDLMEEMHVILRAEGSRMLRYAVGSMRRGR